MIRKMNAVNLVNIENATFDISLLSNSILAQYELNFCKQTEIELRRLYVFSSITYCNFDANIIWMYFNRPSIKSINNIVRVFYFCFFLFVSLALTGLHLRSIEEPYNRMPVEQGGTPGNDNIVSRCGVPLPLSIPPCQPSYEYDPELARMESWMDENPEFIQDYFIR